MLKDYSQSQLEAHKAQDAADDAFRIGDYEKAKVELKKASFAIRESIAWTNHQLDMEYMKNAI